jgi:hypothetical protein
MEYISMSRRDDSLLVKSCKLKMESYAERREITLNPPFST